MKSKIANFFLLLGLVIVAAGGGFWVASEQRANDTAAPPPFIEAEVYRFEFATPAGEMKKLGEWQKHWMVVNFWATWCSPCRREIPAFIDLQNKYADQGVQFVGIALDEALPVQQFAEEQGMNYPVLVGEDDVIVLMQHLGNQIGALPFTAVIAPGGRTLFVKQGEWEASEADEYLSELSRI
ncbi:MAG: TlpA disulfide reductase family protein [Pseudomonadota bacterium]